MSFVSRAFTITGLIGLAASAAVAQTATYLASGTNPGTGSALSAQATLTLSSGVLTIGLQNTGAQAVAPSDALLALMFSLGSGASLTPILGSASGTGFTNAAAYSLGQEWQYRGGISGPNGSNAGVSAAGFGLFSQANFAANGQNLQGMDYGIVNGVSPSANGPTQSAVFVDNAITLRLDAPNLCSLDQISNVYFQYGTDLSEPRLPGRPEPPVDPPAVPEPGTMSLIGVSVLSAIPFASRKRRK